MKSRALRFLAVILATSLFGVSAIVPVRAVSTNYHLEMWIAPLECTRNEVTDGIATNIILTPQQCNELLQPVNNPADGNGTTASIPQAPDTGVFRDTWTTIMTVVVITAFTSGIIALVVRDLRAKSLKIGRHWSIITPRVSSFVFYKHVYIACRGRKERHIGKDADHTDVNTEDN